MNVTNIARDLQQWFTGYFKTKYGSQFDAVTVTDTTLLNTTFVVEVWFDARFLVHKFVAYVRGDSREEIRESTLQAALVVDSAFANSERATQEEAVKTATKSGRVFDFE